MLQLNLGDHTSIVAYYHPIPPGLQWQFQWARTRAFWIAANKPGANPYFQSLPDGRSLTDLLNDNGIWVNYSDGSEISVPAGGTPYGESYHDFKELTITSNSTAVGQWTVLGTLIHELAHLNGAGDDRAAEDALIPCGLGNVSEQTSNTDDPNTPYNPGAIG